LEPTSTTLERRPCRRAPGRASAALVETLRRVEQAEAYPALANAFGQAFDRAVVRALGPALHIGFAFVFSGDFGFFLCRTPGRRLQYDIARGNEDEPPHGRFRLAQCAQHFPVDRPRQLFDHAALGQPDLLKQISYDLE